MFYKHKWQTKYLRFLSLTTVLGKHRTKTTTNIRNSSNINSIHNKKKQENNRVRVRDEKNHKCMLEFVANVLFSMIYISVAISYYSVAAVNAIKIFFFLGKQDLFRFIRKMPFRNLILFFWHFTFIFSTGNWQLLKIKSSFILYGDLPLNSTWWD